MEVLHRVRSSAIRKKGLYLLSHFDHEHRDDYTPPAPANESNLVSVDVPMGIPAATTRDPSVVLFEHDDPIVRGALPSPMRTPPLHSTSLPSMILTMMTLTRTPVPLRTIRCPSSPCSLTLIQASLMILTMISSLWSTCLPLKGKFFSRSNTICSLVLLQRKSSWDHRASSSFGSLRGWAGSFFVSCFSR